MFAYIVCISVYFNLTSIPYLFCLDFQSARTLSLAQGGRGGALLNDTITLNPSLLGFQNIASLSGTMNWLNSPSGPSPQAHKNFNVSVVDGKNEYVAAGVSFTRKPSLDVFHGSLAKKVAQWFSVGVSVKRFSTKSNSDAAAGKSKTGFDGGASFSIVSPPEVSSIPIQIGFTSDNLLNKISHEPFLGPRQIGAGTKININQLLLLYGDVLGHFPISAKAYPLFTLGSEFALGNDFFARGGLLGFKKEKGWGTGVGWVGPKIALNYGFQRKTYPQTHFQHALTLDLYM